MSIVLSLLIAFGLGVLLGKPVVAWAVIQTLIGNLRLLTKLHQAQAENERLRRALGVEDDRAEDALQQARVELASQVGSRRT